MAILNLLKRTTRDRLPRVLRAIDKLIMDETAKGGERDRDIDFEYDHIREAVKYARTLAHKRGMDPDLAGIAAAIQNIGMITTGKADDHAELGYLPAKYLLRRLGGFSEKEIEQLASAVRRHSRKAEKDSPLDELAKDADVYARYCQGHEFRRPEDLARLNRLRVEMF